jgi:putative ABC transport system permease protein
MSIPLIAGRGFQRLDLERGADILISRRAATTLFGDPSGAAALGRRMTLAPSGLHYTVIGVVGDVRDQDLATLPSAMIYRPLVVPIDPSVEPTTPRNMALVVRSTGPESALAPAIRKIVHELDVTTPVYNVEAMRDVVRASTARLSFALALMTAAAAITLALGAIGLYGVMAYMVALRTREFGVRVALGANPKRIARLVASRGLVLTAGGVAAGFVLYAMLAPFLRAFLFGVTVTDAMTLMGATLLLLCTAMFASWLPARRAARIDPAQALRAE